MGACYDGYGDGVRDVCERILLELEKELSVFREHTTGNPFACGVVGGLTKAIEIVRSEM